MDYLEEIRQDAPRILNLTNEVAANFSVNALIAIGASPSMANTAREVKESAKRAQAVVLNTGALTLERAEAILVAGQAANMAGVPVILDPVAVGATTARTTFIHEILTNIKVAVIRGNAGEIAVLGNKIHQTLGPDNVLAENAPSIAEAVAKKYQTIVLSTAETDVITDGERTTLCRNGHSMLQNITASGCTLSSIVGAFISVAGEDRYEAGVEAISGYNIAAEFAMRKAAGPGSFLATFLDELYFLSKERMTPYLQLEYLKK